MIAQTKDFSFVCTRSPLILRLNEPLLSVANDNPDSAFSVPYCSFEENAKEIRMN